MARKAIINAVQTAAVESMRTRLGMNVGEFSEALGLGASTYAEMKRENRVPLTVALAAETLVRRHAPGTDDELVYLTRIVRGVPVVTVLDPNLRKMTLDGVTSLLIPAEEPRRIAQASAPRAGNGSTCHKNADHEGDRDHEALQTGTY